jgi:hypothetical protein
MTIEDMEYMDPGHPNAALYQALRQQASEPRPEHYKITSNGDGTNTWEAVYPQSYPERLESCGQEITGLVVEKNKAYGSAINKVHAMMMVLYPNGIPVSKYMDMLIMVRSMDKLCRIADGDPSAFGENPWRDVAGYGIIGMAVHQK